MVLIFLQNKDRVLETERPDTTHAVEFSSSGNCDTAAELKAVVNPPMQIRAGFSRSLE